MFSEPQSLRTRAGLSHPFSLFTDFIKSSAIKLGSLFECNTSNLRDHKSLYLILTFVMKCYSYVISHYYFQVFLPVFLPIFLIFYAIFCFIIKHFLLMFAILYLFFATTFENCVYPHCTFTILCILKISEEKLKEFEFFD